MPKRGSASGRSGTAATISRAASGWKGRNRSEIATLKKVCPLAIWRAGSAALAATSVTKGPRNGSTMATPRSLKPTWATATRRASVEDPSDAVSAVTQVPTLAPRTSGSAPGRVRSWCEARAITSPIVAAEDATRAAKAAEAATPRIGVSAKASSACASMALSLSGSMPSIISLRPRKISPKPRIACPRSLKSRRLPRKVIANPSPTKRSA